MKSDRISPAWWLLFLAALTAGAVLLVPRERMWLWLHPPLSLGEPIRLSELPRETVPIEESARLPEVSGSFRDLGEGVGLFYGSMTLYLLDIADPPRPTVTATLALPSDADDGYQRRYLGRYGDYLYLAQGYRGAVAVDIADRTAPRLSGSVAPFDRVNHLYCRETLCLTDQGIFDMTDPLHPRSVRPAPGGVRGEALVGETIFALDHGTLVAEPLGGGASRSIVVAGPGAEGCANLYAVDDRGVAVVCDGTVIFYVATPDGIEKRGAVDVALIGHIVVVDGDTLAGTARPEDQWRPVDIRFDDRLRPVAGYGVEVVDDLSPYAHTGGDRRYLTVVAPVRRVTAILERRPDGPPVYRGSFAHEGNAPAWIVGEAVYIAGPGGLTVHRIGP
jgi:hypothetical protein